HDPLLIGPSQKTARRPGRHGSSGHLVSAHLQRNEISGTRALMSLAVSAWRFWSRHHRTYRCQIVTVYWHLHLWAIRKDCNHVSFGLPTHVTPGWVIGFQKIWTSIR